jgi:glucosamine--fructose-6-phosphate aminotransferase (isomerizing)
MRQEIEEQPEVARRVLHEHLRHRAETSKELERRRSIILTGTGASLNACRAARYAFLRYSHLLPVVVHATDIPAYADSIPADSQVILVSQSGNSAETVVAAELLRAKGVPLWGVTNDPDSVLGRHASRVFPLHAGQEVSSATKTYTASVLILYTIAAGEDEGAVRQIERIPDAMVQTLDMAQASVDVLGDDLRNTAALLIAGLGSLSAAAPQAALLVKEKARIHAEGMPMAELRHGPVEIVSPGFPVMVIAAGDAMRREAKRHVEYLTSIGARVWSVVDPVAGQHSSGERNVVPFASGIDEPLCHLAAAVPFQMLAESIARTLGYDVDGFRFLSKVIQSYEAPLAGADGGSSPRPA